MNASRRRIAAVLTASLLAGVVASCGQRGPLYFETEADRKQREEIERKRKERKEREQQKTTSGGRKHATEEPERVA